MKYTDVYDSTNFFFVEKFDKIGPRCNNYDKRTMFYDIDPSVPKAKAATTNSNSHQPAKTGKPSKLPEKEKKASESEQESEEEKKSDSNWQNAVMEGEDWKVTTLFECFEIILH